MVKLNGFDIEFKENIIKTILKLKITSLFIFLVVPLPFSEAEALCPADTILIPEIELFLKKQDV